MFVRLPSKLFLQSTIILRNCHSTTYLQGQSPEPRVREYFYYMDHQGMLFMDDSKVKNFTSCYKDKQFLKFFISRIAHNHSGNVLTFIQQSFKHFYYILLRPSILGIPLEVLTFLNCGRLIKGFV